METSRGVAQRARAVVFGTEQSIGRRFNNSRRTRRRAQQIKSQQKTTNEFFTSVKAEQVDRISTSLYLSCLTRRRRI